jgi:hypothetical protein
VSAVAEPVDIILLSYNRTDYLAAMVDALEQRTRWPHRLTIVDNASGPRTREWLRANADRFERVIWNGSNEHLAGFRHGIEATGGEFYVLSDADLVVAEPDGDECWLTRLVALAARHPDFGLIGVRLDSISAARNSHLAAAPVIDGELIETATGVWLNLIRRAALRIPYMSDGIASHAIRRSGYRVGVAASVYATHLGDQDPERHPDYLARKQAASGWRTTYPAYPELERSAPPPTLEALALAAPVLAALEAHGVAPSEAAELAERPILGAVVADLTSGAPRAVAVLERRSPAPAFAAAAELVVVLAPADAPPPPAGWRLVGEEPGPHRVMLALARIASAPRWRRRLLYSTAEHRERWLAVFRAACFGDDPALRVYIYAREQPAAGAALTSPAVSRPHNPRVNVAGRRLGALITKLRRLAKAEWALLRGRGR